MRRVIFFRTLIVLVVLVLVLTPGCQKKAEPTPVSPSTSTTPITPSETTAAPVSPAEFEVSALSITPNQIVAGEEATVKVDVSNVGGAEGTYTATLTLNGNVGEEKKVTLGGGETETVIFTVTEKTSGTYNIEVGGQTASLTVLKPAELEANSLVVTPTLVLPGQEATVEADIANTGEVEGTLETILKVNGVDTDSRMPTLPAGAEDKVSFTVIRDLPGTYDLSLGKQSATLIVAEVETHENEVYNYDICYPSGWSVLEQSPELICMLKQTFAGIGVKVVLLPATVSQEEYYTLGIEDTEKSNQDYKLLSQSDVQKDNNIKCNMIDYEYTVQGTEWKGSCLFMKIGRYGFAITGDARKSIYEENKPLLDACLESFKPPVVAVDHYTNITHGFSLTLPQGWDGIETGERIPLLVIQSPPDEPLIFTFFYVERLYEDITPQDYVLNFAAFWSDKTSYKITSQRHVTLGEATQGYEVVFTYKEQGLDFTHKVVSVIRGTQAFMLMFYTLSSTYNNEQSAINQLENSFTLEEPKPFGVSRQNSLFLAEGEIVTLDPAIAEGGGGGIIGAIFSGLVRLDRDLKIVPDIAESWEVSDDGTVYTFHLREGVTFHDGKPVTASDFKYSWERACDPEVDSRKALLFLGDIVGGKEMLNGEATELSGVKVIDNLTLEVTIDGAKPYFLDKLAYCTAHVVDRANVARGMNWTDRPNGTGPFKLKEWKKDELLILERNDDYYLEPAKLENIVFQIFTGRSMMMYEQGEIDITGVYTNDLERVQDPTDPLNNDLWTGAAFNMDYLGFNVTMPPFDDPKVRRAFALALDIDKIIEVSFKGNAERSCGFLPQGIPGFNEELEPLPFDPEQALQLIAESKYGSVDNLPPIVFYTLYGLAPAQEAMIGMWQANLGVTVEVEIIEELEEWYERSHNRDFQLFTSGWGADYIDPQNFLEVFFHSQSEENRFAYSNPEVDAALEKAAVEQDEQTRLKMYQDIEKMILEDLPAAPFYRNWMNHVLVKPYVENYFLAPLGINIWQDISISSH